MPIGVFAEGTGVTDGCGEAALRVLESERPTDAENIASKRRGGGSHLSAEKVRVNGMVIASQHARMGQFELRRHNHWASGEWP